MPDFQRPPPPGQIPTHFMTDDEVLVALGNKIRAHRLSLNISHEDLRSHAGVSRSSLNKIENGEPVHGGVFLKVMRSLHLLDAFLNFVPAVEPGYQELRNKKPARKRAGKPRKKEGAQPRPDRERDLSHVFPIHLDPGSSIPSKTDQRPQEDREKHDQKARRQPPTAR